MASIQNKIIFTFTSVLLLATICLTLPIDDSKTGDKQETITTTTTNADQNSDEVLTPMSKINRVQSELTKSIVKKSVEEVQDLLFDTDENDTVRVARETKSEEGKVHRRRSYQSFYPKYYEEAEWPALI